MTTPRSSTGSTSALRLPAPPTYPLPLSTASPLPSKTCTSSSSSSLLPFFLLLTIIPIDLCDSSLLLSRLQIRHQWLRHRVRQPGLGEDARGSVVHISRCSRCYRSWRHLRGKNCHGRDGIQVVSRHHMIYLVFWLVAESEVCFPHHDWNIVNDIVIMNLLPRHDWNAPKIWFFFFCSFVASMVRTIIMAHPLIRVLLIESPEDRPVDLL